MKLKYNIIKNEKENNKEEETWMAFALQKNDRRLTSLDE